MQISWEVWGFKALVHTGWCKWGLRERESVDGSGCFEPRQSRTDGNLWGGGRLTSNLANISAAVWQPTAYTTPNSIHRGCECLLLHNWRIFRILFLWSYLCNILKSMATVGCFYILPSKSKQHGLLCCWTMCYCEANGCFKIEVGVFIKSLQ